MSVKEEAVVAAFDEVIAERGEDWVYPQIDTDGLSLDEILDVTDEWHRGGLCRYSKDTGDYACVWGGVFSKVSPSRLPGPFATDSISLYLYDLVPDPRVQLRVAAAWAQQAQDRGMPYGQVKEGFHRILAMSDDEAGGFLIDDDLSAAGFPDPLR